MIYENDKWIPLEPSIKWIPLEPSTGISTKWPEIVVCHQCGSLVVGYLWDTHLRQHYKTGKE